MRRVVILGLALSVFAAGLMPLSACALISSKMAECAEGKPQSPCDQMHPQGSGTQYFKDSGKSCCVVSQAPLSELQFKAVAVGPAVTIIVVQNIFAISSTKPHSPVHFTENAAPPRLHSLLCTFLI
jgi:hypothetical protein